jgi:hypothetical protein
MFDNEWVYEDDHEFQEAQAREERYLEADDFEEDGQPDEAQEWDDYYGGDNGDHGMYYDQPDPFE